MSRSSAPGSDRCTATARFSSAVSRRAASPPVHEFFIQLVTPADWISFAPATESLRPVSSVRERRPPNRTEEVVGSLSSEKLVQGFHELGLRIIDRTQFNRILQKAVVVHDELACPESLEGD